MFAFVMLTIGMPVMLIVKIDFKIKLNEKVVFAPVAALWAGYIVAQIVAWAKIKKFSN